MASQVLSGSSNVSYTNNTGQNVRIVINYMRAVNAPAGPAGTISLSWANTVNISSTFPLTFSNSIGRSLSGGVPGFPTEIMLAPGQSFSAVCSSYNIVVIPEAG